MQQTVAGFKRLEDLREHCRVLRRRGTGGGGGQLHQFFGSEGFADGRGPATALRFIEAGQRLLEAGKEGFFENTGALLERRHRFGFVDIGQGIKATGTLTEGDQFFLGKGRQDRGRNA